ncbi:hypothetical protein K457DRAFT_23741 [Linnemannia elongata AG-77]|uniref:Hydrophobin n=1 Tax=Linnemannia elongata AG-77 TaxID=1314771 RepID=A0A197JKE4_9FUNG|nr:hypothetical protein K457DRAFT_23741 [Linnemannia elongata AG-77]
MACMFAHGGHMSSFGVSFPNMHFKSLLALCGLLSIAAAIPSGSGGGNGPHTCDANSSDNNLVCCDSVSVLDLTCTLASVLGNNCDSSAHAYCCSSSAIQGGLINVNLGCTKLF